MIVSAGLLLAVTIIELRLIPPADFGTDYRFYLTLAQRFLDGDFYTAHQLAGPYDFIVQVDSLYPPNALFLFLPFLVLPTVLWWAIPIGLTAYVVWSLRPSLWGLAAMLLLLAWPRSIGAFAFGNTDLWAMAAVACGVRWGWPAVFLAIKPTFAPFALIGVRRRSWWVAGILFALASLPFLPLWLQFVEATRNDQSIGWAYSLGSIPLLVVPLVARLSRAP